MVSSCFVCPFLSFPHLALTGHVAYKKSQFNFLSDGAGTVLWVFLLSTLIKFSISFVPKTIQEDPGHKRSTLLNSFKAFS